MTTAPGTAHPTGEPVTSEAVGKRLLRGGIGGFLAGLVFIGITMWHADAAGSPWEGPLWLIHSLVAGKDALPGPPPGGGQGMTMPTADAWIGFAIHSGLSIAFGVVFGLIAPLFRNNGTVAVAGTLYGLALYAVNFQIISRIWFDQLIKRPNQAFEVVIHAIFGLVLALFFYGVGVRRHDRIIDLTGANRRDRETVVA
jgi:hypothetical protein